MPGIGEAKAAQLVAAFELGRRLLADWPAGALDDPRPARRRRPADPPDGPPRARGAAGRACSTRRTTCCASRRSTRATCQLVAGPGRRAVPRRGPAQRGGRDPRPQPPVAATRRRRPDDLHLTAEALAAGRLLDIELLDHLVIGHDAYVSLRDRGVAFDRPEAAAARGRRTVGPDRARSAIGTRAGRPATTRVYCAGSARPVRASRATRVATRGARRRPTATDPARRTRPPPCSTGSSASSPATSGSTSGPPTRWSTSATAGSS